MQEIAVIANEKEYAAYLKENLDMYFENYTVINSYDMNEIEALDTIKENIIVISSFTIFQHVKKKIQDSSALITADITLNKKYIDKLKTLPPGIRALLVNIDYRRCMEVITMIYAAGYRDIELIPYYDGCKYDREIEYAVTPDECDLVPEGIAYIINIGQRVIDINCILEIADKIGVTDIFKNKRAEEARQNILSSNESIEKILGENESLSERLHVLIKLMEQGIIISDIKGKIYLSNDKAESLLRQRAEKLDGFSIAEILPEINQSYTVGSGEDKREELINIGGTDIVVSINPIVSQNEVKGRIITLGSFADIEKRQHKLRTKITGCGHCAVYTFADILGNSAKINEVKEIAKLMANSNSTIMIYGESGTGKEMFAQSIHNYSDRRKCHFVAVNCSALPESLLESELYGYEEGAFSGAKKGGKIGLFELAHRGTIFLDEIGELPLTLQVKLLRVIEERKILKVGGKDLIDIDVRIITATNRNLADMVREGKFREDLYYRLNILPIHIPALRERREDIMLLFNKFRSKTGKSFLISERTEKKFMEYRWGGNVRELKNLTEYMSNLNKDIVYPEDIPFEKTATVDDRQAKATDAERLAIRQFILSEGRSLELYVFILSMLDSYRTQRQHAGRNRLYTDACQQGMFITEQEIKNGLAKLNTYGFIISGRGRKGSVITDSGKTLLYELKSI